jgi:hypothetical protein
MEPSHGQVMILPNSEPPEGGHPDLPGNGLVHFVPQHNRPNVLIQLIFLAVITCFVSGEKVCDPLAIHLNALLLRIKRNYNIAWSWVKGTMCIPSLPNLRENLAPTSMVVGLERKDRPACKLSRQKLHIRVTLSTTAVPPDIHYLCIIYHVDVRVLEMPICARKPLRSWKCSALI